MKTYFFKRGFLCLFLYESTKLTNAFVCFQMHQRHIQPQIVGLGGLSFRNGRTFKNLGDLIKNDEAELITHLVLPNTGEIAVYPSSAMKDFDLKGLTRDVARIIGKVLKITDQLITPNASLYDDLGADSMAVHKILLALGEKFDCDGNLEDACEFEFVNDVINYVEEKCSF